MTTLITALAVAVFYLLLRDAPRDDTDVRLDAFDRDPEAVALRAHARENGTAVNGDGTSYRGGE